MRDNTPKTIETRFGIFDIGPMQVSETYREKLLILLEEEFQRHAMDPNTYIAFADAAEILVRTWDKLRK